jgi:hypothetical protein
LLQKRELMRLAVPHLGQGVVAGFCRLRIANMMPMIPAITGMQIIAKMMISGGPKLNITRLSKFPLE